MDITVDRRPTRSATLRDKINAAGAGVTRHDRERRDRLAAVLRSSTTGAENAFRITAVDADGGNTDASGLSALAFDPAGGTSAMTHTQTAAERRGHDQRPAGQLGEQHAGRRGRRPDAHARRRSRPRRSQVTSAQDTDAIKKAMHDFVNAYNDAGQAAQRPRPSTTPAPRPPAPLQGDSAAIGAAAPAARAGRRSVGRLERCSRACPTSASSCRPTAR